jgi:hypothetical protein
VWPGNMSVGMAASMTSAHSEVHCCGDWGSRSQGTSPHSSCLRSTLLPSTDRQPHQPPGTQQTEVILPLADPTAVFLNTTFPGGSISLQARAPCDPAQAPGHWGQTPTCGG